MAFLTMQYGHICNVAQAHGYIVDKNGLILSMYVCSRINNNLIAECFSLEGLRQLHIYKTVDQLHTYVYCILYTQLTKAYKAETSCNQLVIDSAAYMLTKDQFDQLWSYVWYVYWTVHGTSCHPVAIAKCSVHTLRCKVLISYYDYSYICHRVLFKKYVSLI